MSATNTIFSWDLVEIKGDRLNIVVPAADAKINGSQIVTLSGEVRNTDYVTVTGGNLTSTYTALALTNGTFSDGITVASNTINVPNGGAFVICPDLQFTSLAAGAQIGVRCVINGTAYNKTVTLPASPLANMTISAAPTFLANLTAGTNTITFQVIGSDLSGSNTPTFTSSSRIELLHLRLK